MLEHRSWSRVDQRQALFGVFVCILTCAQCVFLSICASMCTRVRMRLQALLEQNLTHAHMHINTPEPMQAHNKVLILQLTSAH